MGEVLRVALVTGANRGIGLETCRQLVRLGYKVILTARDEPAGEAAATGNLGNVFNALGRFEEAKEHYERHREVSREIGYRQGEAIALTNLGPLQTRLGQTDDAQVTLEESLRIVREIGARRVEGWVLEALGSLHEQMGDPESAQRFYEEALALRREIAYPSGIASTLVALGRLQGSQGREEEAVSHLDQALALARETKTPGTILTATVERARLPDGDVAAALAALAAHEERAGHAEKMDARFRLWELTKDKAHLAEAHRLLMYAREHAPAEYRESMLQNVPLHRDIVAAWEEHGEKR